VSATTSRPARGGPPGDHPDDVRRPGRAAGPRARRLRRLAVIVGFLAVPLGLLFTFTYLPLLKLFQYSVQEWDGLTDATYVGLDNYHEVFTRPELFGVFTVSLYYLAGAAVQLVLALYFATVLSFRIRFRNVFKGILYFPSLINGVAIGFIFLYFFKPGGTLDAVLGVAGFGAPHPQWLGDRSLVNVSLAGVSVWRYMGLNFVLFLGAIQSISPDLYEASQLDGANRWHQFRYIIAPGIRPVIGLTSILAIQGSLSAFEMPWIMTAGANGSETFVTQTIHEAFTFHKVGLAAAMAVVLLLIILVITWVQRRILPDEVTESFT
jgi:multiple sugar transport system permease protein